MTPQDHAPFPRDEMPTDRRAELLRVLTPERLASHVAALRSEITGIVETEAIPASGVDPAAWVALGRLAHAAAGHAQLLGFRRIGALLNALEEATNRCDGTATERARAGLARQLALGAPSLDPAPDRDLTGAAME